MLAGLPSFNACSVRTFFSCSNSSSETCERSIYLGLIAAMCIETSLAAESSVEPSTTVNTPIRPPMCKYAPKASASDFSTISKRRKVIFSPITVVASAITSETLPFGVSTSRASSNVDGFAFKIASEISLTNAWNLSFLATKSVSAFTSKITARFPSTNTLVIPSAAIRSAFLAAFAKPASRK